MTRSELEAMIVKKAGEDPSFRAELLGDPKGTLQKILDELKPGFVLPENLKISVLQETPDQLYLTLPHVPEPAQEQAMAETGDSQGANVAMINSAVCIDVVAVIETSTNAATNVVLT